MSNYYLIFIWIAIFGFLGMFIQMQRTETVCGRKVRRMQPFWAVVLVAPLVVWTANRGYVGDIHRKRCLVFPFYSTGRASLLSFG